MVLAQIALGIVLVFRSVFRGFSFIKLVSICILDIHLVKGGLGAFRIEIARPGGIEARAFQGVLIVFLLRRLFVHRVVRLFL